VSLNIGPPPFTRTPPMNPRALTIQVPLIIFSRSSLGKKRGGQRRLPCRTQHSGGQTNNGEHGPGRRRWIFASAPMHWKQRVPALPPVMTAAELLESYHTRPGFACAGDHKINQGWVAAAYAVAQPRSAVWREKNTQSQLIEKQSRRRQASTSGARKAVSRCER